MHAIITFQCATTGAGTECRSGDAGVPDARSSAIVYRWEIRREIRKRCPGTESQAANGGGIGGILTKYAPEQYRQFLGSNDFKIEYRKYHWGLNDAKR